MNPTTDPRLLLLAAADNCLVTCGNLAEGCELLIDGVSLRLPVAVPIAHKLARTDLPEGAAIVKFGMTIGTLGSAVKRGDLIHIHNLHSAYTPTYTLNEGLTYVQPH